ncbi:glycoside hydrolase family 88 protein [Dinghuibacter silviterrae]|uniref:Glycosyl hydrolase family 88 n=1 Tax=Dinghuibacter silviterrae TaxID=1539049 RepID=A0A4R8DVG5_9BACT|nr:glycoside hydrolase family 88 protein [Dinghuibacter silviterrae]TDX01407.1 glycosyl hydrolase family 88 [Dinghuibacter silviterrae]
MRTLLLLLLSLSASAQWKPDPVLLRTIDTNLQLACTQYKFLADHTPAGVLPRSYAGGHWVTSGPGWWTSGFVAGTMLQLYSACPDTALRGDALRLLDLLYTQQYNKGTHDLGFMMYCSYGTALRVLGGKAFDTVLMNSARSLATRFRPKVGCIRSWDHDKWEYPVIIDNMMNLELLLWASRHSGDTSFRHIAMTHANTTMRNHYRPDYSSFHVVDYDTVTGAVIGRETAQGFADSSAWARGQAWGLYGYTMMYRGTRDPRYLDQANHIAGYLLRRLPADGVPYWDYDDPAHTYRDASAAAVMASAFIELSGYVPASLSRRYRLAAETMLRTLSSPVYRAAFGTNGGFLLMHSVGNMPAHSEIDVPLTYADYYYVEAMLRYRALAQVHRPQSKEEMILICNKFMDGFVKDTYADAFDGIKPYSSIQDVKIDTIALTVKREMAGVRPFYGKTLSAGGSKRPSPAKTRPLN